MRSAIRIVSSSKSGFLETMSNPSFGEIEIHDTELAEITREFNVVYGAALAEWSSLESHLFYWFQLLTGMNEKTARAVFFSARSFNARADMLEAALDAESPGGPLQLFLEAALKKARGYSGFRNSATHGEPLIDRQRGSPTAKQFVIIQGRKVHYEAAETMITMLDLTTATINFRQLWEYLFAMHPAEGPRTSSSLERYRQLVLELPNRPHSTEVVQNLTKS